MSCCPFGVWVGLPYLGEGEAAAPAGCVGVGVGGGSDAGTVDVVAASVVGGLGHGYLPVR